MAPFTIKVPPLTTTGPMKSLALAKVRVPEPDLVSPVVPLILLPVKV